MHRRTFLAAGAAALPLAGMTGRSAGASEDDLDRRARAALGLLDTIEPVPFARTTHPEAQWFPGAGFGLFAHWGIHSVAGIEPSWAMMRGCPWQKDFIADLGWERWQGRENYYTLLARFDPRGYDPDRWIAAAARAGMTYAVLTAKHHDGYALWPSRHGALNTGTYLHGRDLLSPFVDACRRHGLKIGFYFSPRDWGYPGYPQNMTYGGKYAFPADWTPEKNQAAFDEFYRYTVGQISELLTRYGRIDLLWFDGMGWDGISDIRTERTLAWVRAVQPHIVLNPRWGGQGDYDTPEVSFPDDVPDGWWENCISWRGHWGYAPYAPFQPESWVISRLVRARAWGGNLLLNVGPDGDGCMDKGYYAGLGRIAAWMDRCRDTLIGAEPVSTWNAFSSVPLTRQPGVWYAHVLPESDLSVRITGVPKPRAVRFLNRDVPLTTWNWDENSRIFSYPVSMTVRDDLNNVIAIEWSDEPPVPAG